MISVHFFGTCRVHAPLVNLAQRGDIRLLEGSWSFLHAPNEILQAIEFNEGTIDIEEEHAYLAGFVNGLSRSPLEAADVFIVEVSSVKAFKYFSTSAQLNRIREKTVSVEDKLDAWFKELERQGVTNGWSQSNVELDLSKFSCKKLHEFEILSLVLKILEKLNKPTLLVSSFNYPDSRTKTYLPVRTSLIDTLKKVKAPNLIDFFDPTTVLEQYGFEQNTTDSAHYSDSFIPIIADNLMRIIKPGKLYNV